MLPFRAELRAPSVFFNDPLQRFPVEAQIGSQRLQSAVLLFQIFDAFQVVPFQSAILGAPGIQGVFADPQFPADLLRLSPSL